jgi:uncharacterized metal-binding protein YceD (DUF177 family)
MMPELHRPIAIERVGPGGLDVTVEATRTECDALARRMKLPALLALTCAFHLERESARSLLAYGNLVAHVMQTCVVSLEEFPALIEERFVVRCVPQGEEIEDADPDSPDEIPYSDRTLDLGEATAEQLALALDPYPHAPGATVPEFPDEPPARPFDALAGWRRRH